MLNLQFARPNISSLFAIVLISLTTSVYRIIASCRAKEDQSFIITSFRYPSSPAFVFADFYERLWTLGFAIYPGRLSHEACFRIGTIGRIATNEIETLLQAIRRVLDEMGVDMLKEKSEDIEPHSRR